MGSLCMFCFMYVSCNNFITAKSRVCWAICDHQLAGWSNGILIWTCSWWQKSVSCHRLHCEFYETLSSKNGYAFILNVVSTVLMGIFPCYYFFISKDKAAFQCISNVYLYLNHLLLRDLFYFVTLSWELQSIEILMVFSSPPLLYQYEIQT
jgi:hypothetical protein